MNTTKVFLLFAASSLVFLSGITEAIECYDCQYNSAASNTDSRCKDGPASSSLVSFYDSVSDPFLASTKAASPQFQAIVAQLEADMKVSMNATIVGYLMHDCKNVRELAANPGINAVYDVLCLTWDMTVNVEGEKATIVLRSGYPILQSSSSDYNNKCQSSDPPNLEKVFSSPLFPYRTSNNFCFCRSDACNGSGVKPTASALVAIASIFLIKYFP